jgi:hypothetical protein
VSPARRWRILYHEGRTIHYVTEAAMRAAATKRAANSSEDVILEQWDESHPQDHLNQGWAMIGSVPAGRPTDKPQPSLDPTRLAPLAQLRLVDKAEWDRVMASGRTDRDATRMQAAAARFLGDEDLASTIERNTFATVALLLASVWPDLTVGKVHA